MITAEPLLELLRDAAARDRPALTLTFGRVVELLGEMPGEPWWAENRAALGAAGFDAAVDHERRWVTFAPVAEEPAFDEAVPTGIDVRVTFQWSQGAATDATAWVDDEAVPFELSAESARNLAVAARRGDR